MEQWIACAVESAFVLLFVILGILFSKGKGAFLIAGYNTARPEEKKTYNEKALCRFMGKLMFALAGCEYLLVLGTALNRWWLYGVGIAAFLAVAAVGIVYANTGNRFRKRK